VRSSLDIRWAAPAFLLLYCLLRYLFPDSVLVNELILYNVIPLAALVATITTPGSNNLNALIAISLAIATWWIGSLLSSYTQYIESFVGADKYIDLFYLLFYPLILFSLHRIGDDRRGLSSAEVRDFIFLSSIIFGFIFILITNRSSEGVQLFGFHRYIYILYIFFDVILIMWVARILIIDGVAPRNTVLSIGLLLFIASDLAFIWASTFNSYASGELLDFGWLAGITLISLAVWCKESTPESRRTIHPFTLITSLLISVALLTLLALGGDEASSELAIPAFLALLLAMMRISTIIRKSHQLSDESYLALTDELTGLANRRKIIAELSEFGEEEGAFLLLDLNGFKPINDQYGHSVGDELLIEIAERFTRALPDSAVVARLGGDEFGVIIKGSYEETLEGAYALRASLSYPFTISGKKILVGVSIGYVHNDGCGDLLKRADIAMYQAKNSVEGVVQS
jgi:diguanylate cyclase (GGDEF)-like protein